MCVDRMRGAIVIVTRCSVLVSLCIRRRRSLPARISIAGSVLGQCHKGNTQKGSQRRIRKRSKIFEHLQKISEKFLNLVQ